jgi:hypothetical protein
MTTIPKNWKVRITEDNREVLEQWRIKQPNVDQCNRITCLSPYALNYWLISDKYDGSYMDWGGGDSYQEITFEEFKKYVLMEQPKIEFKPITMDCNQQQFDTIKPILEKHGFTFDRGIWNFTRWPYLTNNYPYLTNNYGRDGLSKIIGNAPDKNHGHRPYGGQWNQDLFLRCCGIDPTYKFKVGDKVIIKKDSNGYGDGGWKGEFQNIIQTQGYLTISQEYTNQDGIQTIDFEESPYGADSRWLTLYTENKTEMKTYNIKISDLKKIHDVACLTWKTKIKSLITDPFAESIELSQSQVDEMFKAATTDQRPVLVEVFGEPVSYKEGQIMWGWDKDGEYKDWEYPTVIKFTKVKDGKIWGIWAQNRESPWDHVAPFNNGQLPEQFKHLLDNQ